MIKVKAFQWSNVVLIYMMFVNIQVVLTEHVSPVYPPTHAQVNSEEELPGVHVPLFMHGIALHADTWS